MKNFIQPGEVMEVTAGANIASGDVVAVGEMVGVAAHDIANGATGEVSLCGVYLLAKAAGVWTQGQKLFWDKVAKAFVGVASADADVVAGYAFKAAANGDATGYVKLCGMPQAPKVVASQANSVAADVAAMVVDFNALLAKLKAAGVMDN